MPELCFTEQVVFIYSFFVPFRCVVSVQHVAAAAGPFYLSQKRTRVIPKLIGTITRDLNRNLGVL